MAAPAVTVDIRPLTADDLDAVLAVEETSFVEPWSAGLFAAELAQPSRAYVAAIEAGRLCGYGGLMIVGEEATIVTLAVAPGKRQRGIASRLMVALIDQARARGVRHLTLEVRESNQAARLLYEKFGFEEAGVRKGYYRTEDAVVMWAVDIDSVDYGRTVQAIRQEAT